MLPVAVDSAISLEKYAWGNASQEDLAGNIVANFSGGEGMNWEANIF